MILFLLGAGHQQYSKLTFPAALSNQALWLTEAVPQYYPYQYQLYLLVCLCCITSYQSKESSGGILAYPCPCISPIQGIFCLACTLLLLTLCHAQMLARLSLDNNGVEFQEVIREIHQEPVIKTDYGLSKNPYPKWSVRQGNNILGIAISTFAFIIYIHLLDTFTQSYARAI